MEKHQVVSFIESQVRAGTITADDLRAVASGADSGAFAAAAVSTTHPTVGVPAPTESSRNLINTFYGIGALIVLAGAVILVGQHWEDIGFMGRILVTLGIAAVTFFSALMLGAPERRVIAQVFFTIAAALFPLGFYVLVDEQAIDFDAVVQMWTALGLLVAYIVAYFLTRRNILVILSVAFATWAFYAFLVDFAGDINMGDLFKWGTLVAGIAYILIGYAFRSAVQSTGSADEKEKTSVGSFLYAFGTLALLGAAISFGGIWDLIFIAIVFATFYLSVYIKSRAMLILSALFLVGHIFKLTSRYFVDSIGWPISLVVIGFLVIGIGALTYNVHKRFLTR